jgi:hypothetical protein
MPKRRAVNAWPSSCSRTDNSRQITNAKPNPYAAVGERSSWSPTNCPYMRVTSTARITQDALR